VAYMARIPGSWRAVPRRTDFSCVANDSTSKALGWPVNGSGPHVVSSWCVPPPALQDVASRHERITNVRGLGLMLGSEFRDANGKPDGVTAAAAQQEAAKRGLLLTCGAWGEVVRFIPALIVNSEQVKEAGTIWADTVSAVTA
jgi:hypothetical protein